MIFDKMIETENSDPVRELWTSYRSEMTSYVRDGIENVYRHRHLMEQGKRRDPDFTLEGYLPFQQKPIVAIWGAGRCNDLDLSSLVPYVNFVLIDRDVEAVQDVKRRYGFSDVQCVCTDLGFWEIYEEEERFFETLLPDADDLHLSEYLRQLMESIEKQPSEYDKYRGVFDFSVICGVASQLNARFAGLLFAYGKKFDAYPETVSVLSEMNARASARLFNAVTQTTKLAFFTANEMCAANPERAGMLEEYAQMWTEEWEFVLAARGSEPLKKSDTEGICCQIAGSREFRELISKAHDDGILQICHRDGKIWPFSKEKYYFMDVLTACFVNKETKKQNNFK